MKFEESGSGMQINYGSGRIWNTDVLSRHYVLSIRVDSSRYRLNRGHQLFVSLQEVIVRFLPISFLPRSCCLAKAGVDFRDFKFKYLQAFEIKFEKLSIFERKSDNDLIMEKTEKRVKLPCTNQLRYHRDNNRMMNWPWTAGTMWPCMGRSWLSSLTPALNNVKFLYQALSLENLIFFKPVMVIRIRFGPSGSFPFLIGVERAEIMLAK